MISAPAAISSTPAPATTRIAISRGSFVSSDSAIEFGVGVGDGAGTAVEDGKAVGVLGVRVGRGVADGRAGVALSCPVGVGV